MSSILFIHLGRELPAWLEPALAQARLFNRGEIVLVAHAAALRERPPAKPLGVRCVPVEELPASAKREAFQRTSPQDRGFRDGFFTFTTERFFIVESALAALPLSDVVHVENDVLLYCDVAALAPKLRRLYPGLGATFDNDTSCVPGFVYIPHERAIAALTDFILQVFARQPDARLTDMDLLGAFRQLGPRAIDHLPIVPADYPGALRSAAGHVAAEPGRYSNHFAELGFVFDAAALGQYLGGVDPRNDPRPSRGFINESCVFDPRLLKLRMAADDHGRQIPVIETASGRHRVANLHIHSKNPDPFLSTG